MEQSADSCSQPDSSGQQDNEWSRLASLHARTPGSPVKSADGGPLHRPLVITLFAEAVALWFRESTTPKEVRCEEPESVRRALRSLRLTFPESKPHRGHSAISIARSVQNAINPSSHRARVARCVHQRRGQRVTRRGLRDPNLRRFRVELGTIHG